MRDIFSETFDAVLFDNDGTLIDSRAAVERSWLAWAAHHDVPAARLVGFHGVTSSGIVAAVAPHLDPATATADIDRRELEDAEGVVALPGAQQAMAAVGDRAAIVTSAGRELAVLRLRAAGLTAPGAFVTADDISRGKPHPEPYLLGARRLDADPGRCLVVEDAPAGVTSAKAAGCPVIGVLTTHSTLDAPTVTSLDRIDFRPSGSGVRVGIAGERGRSGEQ